MRIQIFPVQSCLLALGFLIFVIGGCGSVSARTSASDSISRDERYPRHWWTPVSRASAPDWEILPQEASPGEVILSKRNELGLLSNLSPTPFVFRGKRYASLEGFWQMMLYPEGADDPRAAIPGIHWSYTREQVAQMTASMQKTPARWPRRT